MRDPRITATIVLILATVVGCGGGEPASSPEAYGGTVVIAGSADLDRANPLVTTDANTQEINRFLLFMPLVRYAPDLSIEPYLARSWTMDGDTAITFELRRDVLWHDSVRTTADDVRFTLEAAMDPETAYPNASLFANWLGVEVIDSFTVRATFRPHADPLSAAALLPIVPAHRLAEINRSELGTAEFNRAPVGNGPFRFATQQASDRWVFEANPDFPEALGGRPYVDRVVWRVIPERQTQLTELLTGNAHVVLSTPAESFTELSDRPELNGLVRPSFKYAFVGWNGRRTPFGDPRVRRALTMAIDRATIIDALRAGEGQVATGPVHPNHWAHDPSLEPLPFDPAAARSLLAETGITDHEGDGSLERADGTAFAFDLEFQANNDFNKNMAEMIQADLARIGVGVRPRPVEWNTLVSHVSSPERDFDAVLMGWEADFRIDLTDLFHSGALDGPFQLASYTNRTVDELLDQVSRISDREASLPVWFEIQEILRDEQPWSFLYYYPDLILTSARLEDVEMDLRGVMVGIHAWRWRPDSS